MRKINDVRNCNSTIFCFRLIKYLILQIWVFSQEPPEYHHWEQHVVTQQDHCHQQWCWEEHLNQTISTLLVQSFQHILLLTFKSKVNKTMLESKSSSNLGVVQVTTMIFLSPHSPTSTVWQRTWGSMWSQPGPLLPGPSKSQPSSKIHLTYQIS